MPVKISRSKLVLILIVFHAVMFAGIFAWRSLSPGGRQTQANDLYYCPMHPAFTSQRPGTCSICNMSLVLREKPHAPHDGDEPRPREFTLQEVLAMKPHEVCLLHKCQMGNCMIAITEENVRLGKCPHCGEDLGIIVKDLAPKGYAAVDLASEAQELIGIKTALAVRKVMTKTIRTSGRIAYDPELYQAEEEYLQAVRAEQKARTGTAEELKAQAAKLVDSSRMRLKLLGLSDELIRELEKADKPDRSLLISEGGGQVWLYAPVYEFEISLVKAGGPVEAEVPGVTQEPITGTIRSIDPIVDPLTRSVRVRAVLDNAGGRLKPQMYVNAVLKIDLGEVLTVPAEAVFATGEKNIIFVAKANNVFEPRNVVLGAKAGNDYEIRQGVSAGERVVTSGNFLIDSESQLKAALDVLGTENHSGHRHG